MTRNHLVEGGGSANAAVAVMMFKFLNPPAPSLSLRSESESDRDCSQPPGSTGQGVKFKDATHTPIPNVNF